MGQIPLPKGSNAYFYLGIGVAGLVVSMLAGRAGPYTTAGPLGFDVVIATATGATVMVVLSLAGVYRSIAT